MKQLKCPMCDSILDWCSSQDDNDQIDGEEVITNIYECRGCGRHILIYEQI